MIGYTKNFHKNESNKAINAHKVSQKVNYLDGFYIYQYSLGISK